MPPNLERGFGGPSTGTALAIHHQQENGNMKPTLTKSPGMLLLGIWLILVGLSALVPLISSLAVVLNVVCVTAGVLILIGR